MSLPRSDERTGIATWIFTTINPATGQAPVDPTVGFLPPDNSSGIGEGFVSYTILANPSDPTGTVIDAQATVTFDTQPPLNTPQIFSTIDAGTDLTSAIAPLPARENAPQFTVAWSGTDANAGSAISGFTIYVSDDNAPYTPWLTDTTLTSAPYDGQMSHTYRFYSVARDNAGNQEAAPLTAQATTAIQAPLAATTTTLTSSVNASIFGQSVTFSAVVSCQLSVVSGPSGTVTFLDGSTSLGTALLNSNEVATFATSSLTVGSHTITASYSGDTNFSGSSSSPMTQTVGTPLEVTSFTPTATGFIATFSSSLLLVTESGGDTIPILHLYDDSLWKTGCS